MDSVLVTGGAGFIGSHIVDRLLALGRKVTAFDNLSTGFEEFLSAAAGNPRFTFVKGDLLDEAALNRAMQASSCSTVFHLAANADVRFGTERPRRDLEQNVVATFNVLEAMRNNTARRIVFASTGSIYGEPDLHPTPETAPFPVQTSLYGASKLAAEGLISAYCEGFGFQGWIFRFVSVVGERYTHGHIFDFHRMLMQDSTKLDVLGDGNQRKSYIYVHDCIDGILTALGKANEKVNILNVGTDEYVKVTESIAVITAHLGCAPQLRFAGGPRGWVGDSPFIFLDTAKLRALGWTPRLSIRDGIRSTLAWLQANPWVYARRGP